MSDLKSAQSAGQLCDEELLLHKRVWNHGLPNPGRNRLKMYRRTNKSSLSAVTVPSRCPCNELLNHRSKQGPDKDPCQVRKFTTGPVREHQEKRLAKNIGFGVQPLLIIRNIEIAAAPTDSLPLGDSNRLSTQNSTVSLACDKARQVWQ